MNSSDMPSIFSENKQGIMLKQERLSIFEFCAEINQNVKTK
jgi:hypothetical protein